MKTWHWATIAVVLVVGYWIGKSYPSLIPLPAISAGGM